MEFILYLYTVSVPVDVAIFLFKVDSEGEPTDLITFTQHNIEGRWSFKESLEAGSYALVPSSSGCWLKKDEEDDNRGRGEEGKIVKRDGSSLSLTEDCKYVSIKNSDTPTYVRM